MLEHFEGIVLFKQQYRDDDSIVKIITPTYGKRMFFIKKGQQANHRLHSQTIALTTNQYTGTINPTGFSFIKEAETLSFPKVINQDLTLQAYASYFVQLVDAAFEDFEPNVRIYNLLKQSIYRLNEGFNHELLLIYFELNILSFFGTSFDFNHCQICGKTNGPFDVSIRLDGVLCYDHLAKDNYRLNVSPKAVYLANMLSTLPLEKIQSIQIKDETLSDLKKLTKELFQEYVGIKLKSKQFIEELAEIDQKYHQLLKNRGNKPKEESH